MKIEFILRESTIKDVIGPWVNAGKEDNTKDGSFVFDELTQMPWVENGLVYVETDNAQYIYNVSDFYRVKISGELAEQNRIK